MENISKRLKPVTFLRGDYGYTRNDDFQQRILLKAMQVSMDPKFLMQSAGIKTIAELQRTLDKMAIRKEYHNTLVENGMDLDFIVKGFKELADSPSDVVRLGTYKALLKSVGLNEYKESEVKSDNSWEDLVNSASELERSGVEVPQLGEYEVDTPAIPEAEKKKREDEAVIGKELYDNE